MMQVSGRRRKTHHKLIFFMAGDGGRLPLRRMQAALNSRHSDTSGHARPGDKRSPESGASAPDDRRICDDRERLSVALQGAAAGDKAAFRRVYDQTSAKLFGICLRILGDRCEAEDVLQDVYANVWRRAGSFDPDRGVSPITWLAVLARNQAIDRLRASKDYLRRPLEQAAVALDPSPLPSEMLEHDDTRRLLDSCLGELEPDHAAYIRAAFLDGQTYATLAAAAGVPLSTMKSWVRRALLQLRRSLERSSLPECLAVQTLFPSPEDRIDAKVFL